MNRIWLLRHGHQDGVTDRLTAKGFERVGRVAEWLRPRHPRSIFTSPALRTWETAAALATLLGLDGVEEYSLLGLEELKPVHSPWTCGFLSKGAGQPLLVAWLSLAPKLRGRVSYLEERLWYAMEEWRTNPRFQDAVLVTHGELMRAIGFLLASRAPWRWLMEGSWHLRFPKGCIVECGTLPGRWGYRNSYAPGSNSQATVLRK